jgi:cystathionine beta-synthase
MFNDDWMRERGFLEEEVKKAEDVIKIILKFNCCSYRRTSVPPIERMRKYKISQMVMDMSGFVGSWMSLTCFKVMYMIKTQPKDQLRK